MLGRRGKDTEHSAMRKVKNEFMSSWDGLRTKDCNRILVLGATNRPFDLDDAVVRRFPRRYGRDPPLCLPQMSRLCASKRPQERTCARGHGC